jgi:poly [ADP-ribose] polymerase
LELLDVFSVEREGEQQRFQKDCAKMDNKMLLVHGSRLTNFVGILSQGLKIAPPDVPVSGYLFGKGLYFADMIAKSAGYCR